MTKAEELALKHFPKEDAKVFHSAFGILEFDKHAAERKAYQKGYEQSEKDLALTPEDVAKIFNKVRELQAKYPATEACFEEVAKWFNNLKGGKK